MHKLIFGFGALVLFTITPVSSAHAFCDIASTYPGYEWLNVGMCGCTAHGAMGLGGNKEGWTPEHEKACEKLCSDTKDCLAPDTTTDELPWERKS